MFLVSRFNMRLAALLQLAAISFAPSAPNWPSELPSYPKYPMRAVQVLSGEWDFGFTASYNPENTTTLSGLTFERTQAVPGAWDAAWGTGLQYARGVGAYRTRFSTPLGSLALLHFEACSMFCRIYVDGQLLHNHSDGGFTPFWVNVPPLAPSHADGVRELVVISSNNFSKVLTPTQQARYDFYQFGGLLRTASLHVLPQSASPSIDRVEVMPLAIPPRMALPSGAVNVTAVLRGAPAPGTRLNLSFSWDGGPPTIGTHAVEAGGMVRICGAAVPNAKMWQPEPNPTAVPRLPLHTLTVAIPCGGDAITVRFGLRIIAASGRHILLNGQLCRSKA